MITPSRRILLWIALLGLPTVAVEAQNDAAAAGSAPDTWEQQTISRIRDLFEIELPTTERTGQIKLSFQPHFRDLLNEDYLRLPLELRWGVNDHFELNSEIDTYFDHGLRKGNGGYGISTLHFGAKYAWLEWLKPTWDASVGINSSIPVSRPPIELTDGHDHITPYIVFGRKLGNVPGLSGVINVSTDFMSASSTPGAFERNEPHSNSLTVSPGLLYDHHAWHYTLEVDGTTTRFIGSGSHDFLTIRPGVIWDLPKVLVFNARGRWLAGFNLTFVFGPDGNTISTGGRLRGELNLTRLFGGHPPPNPPPVGPTPGN
jgi:hypothetical protein